MARVPRKLTALLTALVVLVAHALCLCRTATAVAATHPAPAAAHHCCKHESPDKSPAPDGQPHDTDGHCRHCDGFAAPAVKAGDSSMAHVPALQAVPAEICAAHRISLQLSAVDPAASPVSEFVSPPTLLRLSCALNL